MEGAPAPHDRPRRREAAERPVGRRYREWCGLGHLARRYLYIVNVRNRYKDRAWPPAFKRSLPIRVADIGRSRRLG
jgi:hypothetical protein